MGRVVAHRVAGAHAAPDLRGPAVRRHRHRRPADAERRSTTRRSSASTSGPGGSPPPASRVGRSSSACSSASRSPPGSWPRAPATSSASSARCPSASPAPGWCSPSRRPCRSPSSPTPSCRRRFFLLIPGIFVDAVAGRARQGALVRLRHRHRCSSSPGSCSCRSIGWLADEYGIRTGLVVAAPVFVVGGLILASAGTFVEHDIAQVWKSTAARAEVAHAPPAGQGQAAARPRPRRPLRQRAGALRRRPRGRRGRDRRAARHQRRREVDAAAGHLRASCRPSAGAVVFDGRDMTHTPPDEIAGRGRVAWCPAARACSPSSRWPRTCASRRGWHQGPGGRGQGRHRAGARTCSRSCASASTSRPATCPAASSRC